MASGKTMHRSICAFALLAFAFVVSPAFAGDATVTFECCRYTPDSVRIAPNGTVTFTGSGGADFQDVSGSTHHPLHFTNPSIGDQTSGTTTDRSFNADGVYLWYCGNHGHFDGTNVTGMAGKVVVTNNQLPVANFTASASNVASGTEVTFDGSASYDPDGSVAGYAWDLDGNGTNDPGQTAEYPSAIFTNTSAAPRTVTVRLTVTDNNADAVGPETATKTMVITVQPAPGSGTPSTGGGGGAPPGGADTGPAADTTAPTIQLKLAKTLTVGSKLRLAFTSDEPVSALATLKLGKRSAKARKDFGAAGRHTLSVKLSRPLRRLLRHRRTVTLALAVTDDAGNGTTVRRTLRLRSR